MTRWKPNAADRLVAAALDLFEQRGYENTTVIDIAQRAGLTKSTFFRHFQDKREVLFGGDTMARLLIDGITAAPATATPLEAVTHAFDSVGELAFTPERRDFTIRRRAVIIANPELHEREARKGRDLTASMVDALGRRGVPDLTARVAAELAALAMTIAYEQWSDAGEAETGAEAEAETEAEDFAKFAQRALDDVRTAVDEC